MSGFPCPPKLVSGALLSLLLAVISEGTGAGCNSFKIGPAVPADKPALEACLGLPSKHSFRLSQFAFFYDFELKKQVPLFDELTELREQVYKELKLPPSDTLIEVYLFEDHEHYERYMQAKYPNFPKRRAFFVAQPRKVGEDLLVYTYWGPRIQQDLRHELTHALLHSVLKGVPLWLDEGLAEYYELPPDKSSSNQTHLEQIRRGSPNGFTPDLARLEGLTEMQDMNAAEYREAWAWVHLLLRDKPEARNVLTAYLKQLRATDKPGSLKARLADVFPSLDKALERHLAHLEPSGVIMPVEGRE
jgi:hypothetical protein